jgi:transposase InsO family protein
VHRWIGWYRDEGLDGLAGRSSRPHAFPMQTPPEVEAAICELRRTHPRWGARRIEFELGRNGCPGRVPSRITIHRVLVRHGLVDAAPRRRRREDYRRWQRAVPMELWQLDIVDGIQLADGSETKVVTGVDDHSRFCVIATVVRRATGQAVCLAFGEALRQYGIPDEVLTDNGKQFTGRFTKPRPAEVMFERICRENGIVARNTKPRTPTTTGKVERFHQTLQRELLHHVDVWPDLETAQAAIDAFRREYNTNRPHQSLDMAFPADRFTPRPADDRLPLRLPTALSAATPTARIDRTRAAVPSPAAPGKVRPAGDVRQRRRSGRPGRGVHPGSCRHPGICASAANSSGSAPTALAPRSRSGPTPASCIYWSTECGSRPSHLGSPSRTYSGCSPTTAVPPVHRPSRSANLVIRSRSTAPSTPPA